MQIWNQTAFRHEFTMAMDKAGHEYILLVVKGTFDFPAGVGGPVRASETQVPLVMADEYTGAPGFSAPLWETDFAFRRPRCDIVLNGAAYAPGARPAERVRVGLKVGAWSKVFDVLGHREWRARGPLFAATSPEPFLRRPFSYDTAWGGTDRLDPEDELPASYPRNPIGTGWSRPRNQRLIPGLALPSTQAVGEEITSPFGDYTPMSFGPMGRGWPGRIEHGGTYDQNWIDNIFPFLPPDFDDRYFQMSPPDQQTDPPRGGEEVILANLTPQGKENFRLPPTTLPVTLFKGREKSVEADLLPRHPPFRPREPPPLPRLARLLPHPPHHPRLHRGLGRPADRSHAPRPPRRPRLHPRRRRPRPRGRGRMTTQLDVLSVGMVTAVGLDTPSACAAMRARLDGFQETHFRAPGGEGLVGAPVPLPRNWIGEKRLAHMAAAAIVEALDAAPEARGKAIPILCLAEEDRPGRPAPDSARLAARIAGIVDAPGLERVRIVAHGRPSGHLALERASRLLQSGRCEYALLVGADSYLTGGTIGHYLDEDRLLVPDNPNGFIPGEGAAALLCTVPGRGRLGLRGLGLARERAHIYNPGDLALRGDGMASAYRTALATSEIPLNLIGYRIADLIGEQYWFKQSALASMRNGHHREEFQDLWSPGESLGNVGAAVVPVMIGMAFAAASKSYAPGSSVLVEASNDAGACGAAVLVARNAP